MTTIDDKIMSKNHYTVSYNKIATMLRHEAAMIGGDHYDNKTAEQKIDQIAEELDNLNMDNAIFMYNVYKRMLNVIGFTESNVHLIRSQADFDLRNNNGE